ncbi:MAG: T9SS type A sorting domain-containing protein [Bacteroidetes bacterium]|nr:T9SS type A sorting domain-containing protein [Bacteroidota bacterium]
MKQLFLFLSFLSMFSFHSIGQNAGDIDSTFGIYGFADSGQPSTSQFGAIALQPDSNIVCVQRIGSGVYDIVLTRFLPDGSPDVSFGTGGVALTVTAINETPTSVALMSNGKILVGSSSSDGTGGFGTVSCYKTDGSPDSTFALNGIYKSKFPGSTGDGINALTVLSNGEIIAAGLTASSSGTKSSIIKLFPNGTLDSTFGVNGRVIGNSLYMFSLAIQSDGKIVLGGRKLLKMAISRYTSTGIVDSTFGTNGMTVTDHDTSTMSWAIGLFVLPNGNIIGAGAHKTSNLLLHQFMAMEVDSNGVINSSYGTNGAAVDSMPGTYITLPTAAAMQTDNKIIIAGNIAVDTSSGYHFSMVRFNVNGTVDNSFGNNGMVLASQGGRAYCDAVTIQPDHKILIGGMRDFGSGTSTIAVARFGSGIISGMETISRNLQPLTVYPNPSGNEIHLMTGEAGDYEIRIFNMLGMQVEFRKMKTEQHQNIPVYVRDYAPGIYQFTIIGKSGTQSGRFVKE